jgi:hypothetical protein
MTARRGDHPGSTSPWQESEAAAQQALALDSRAHSRAHFRNEVPEIVPP